MNNSTQRTFYFDFHLYINTGTWNTDLDLSDPFLGWCCHQRESKLQNFEIVVSKMNTSPQSSLYYWLLSFYHHWYMRYKLGLILIQFWINDITTGVKIAIFWEIDLRKNLLTSKFHLIHDIQLWVLHTLFGDNDITKEIFQNFEKLTKELFLIF